MMTAALLVAALIGMSKPPGRGFKPAATTAVGTIRRPAQAATRAFSTPRIRAPRKKLRKKATVESEVSSSCTKATPKPKLRASAPKPTLQSSSSILTLPSSAPTTLPSTPPAEGLDKFDWFGCWYPVSVVETMDRSRPHALQLLGLNLVAWNDGPMLDGRKQPGRWQVFADACPHRLGPLSEGRVEADGSLLCSYHGWRFNGTGACVDLPYALPEQAQRHCRSCRSRCDAFPTRVEDGLLWVFPRTGPMAEAEAEAAELPLISELHEPALAGRWNWRIPAGVRDFPCGWDAMVENTLDPAHFCSAHHGTLGNRYTDPAPYVFQTTRPVDLATGFALDSELGQLEFVPPCLVKYTPDYAAMPFNGSLVIATYCVPTRPGWVRPLANVLVDREAALGSTLSERALRLFMGGWTPYWLGHVLSSVVLHQDAGLLYKQYRNLRERGMANPAFGTEAVRYEQLVFCPTSVDKGVLQFRRWLHKAGGSIPWACEDALPPRGTEQIYDMWDAHTSSCKYCQDAYRNLEALKHASIVLLALAVLLMPEGYERAAVALTSGTLAAALQRFNNLFKHYEFSHADND